MQWAKIELVRCLDRGAVEQNVEGVYWLLHAVRVHKNGSGAKTFELFLFTGLC
jgi:hypothetical protein